MTGGTALHRVGSRLARGRGLWRAAQLVALAWLVSLPALAQPGEGTAAAAESASPPEAITTPLEDVSLPTPPVSLPAPPVASPKGSRPGEVAIAPIPFSNPTLDSGLGLGLGYIFKPDPGDKLSPPSIVGLGGLYTQNGSWGAGALGSFHLRGDKYRLAGLAAYGDVTYKFFGIGEAAGDRGLYVDLCQKMDFILLQGLQRVRPHTYAGLRLQYLGSEFGVTAPGTHVPDGITVPSPGFTATSVALGLRVQFDTRDNSFSARRGTYADLGLDFYDDLWGSDYSYQVYELALNRYFTLSPTEVLAVRGYGRFTSGDVPFWGLCCFGMHSDLRGYTSGQYRDRHMVDVQVEYRRHLTGRLGAVAFAGVGAVAPSVGSFNVDSALTSWGVGLRYRITPQTPLNYSIDYANAAGEDTLTFSVGEAF